MFVYFNIYLFFPSFILCVRSRVLRQKYNVLWVKPYAAISYIRKADRRETLSINRARGCVQQI